MRLRSLILVVAVGLAVAWWYENLAAAYVAIFGSLILRGLRIVQFNAVPVSAGRPELPAPSAANAVENPASLLILQRRAVVEKLGKRAIPKSEVRFNNNVADAISERARRKGGAKAEAFPTQ